VTPSAVGLSFVRGQRTQTVTTWNAKHSKSAARAGREHLQTPKNAGHPLRLLRSEAIAATRGHRYAIHRWTWRRPTPGTRAYAAVEITDDYGFEKVVPSGCPWPPSEAWRGGGVAEVSGQDTTAVGVIEPET